MGIDILNKDLEGYQDAALGTIVFNKTKIPKTNCEEYRSVAEINEGMLYRSKLGEFSILKYVRDGETVAVTIDNWDRKTFEHVSNNGHERKVGEKGLVRCIENWI